MNFIKTVLNRPVSALLIIFSIIVFGVSSLAGMKMEYFPNLEMPMEVVVITWAGADADSMSRLVCEPIEDVGETLTGVTSIESQAYENYATVQISYEYDTDIDDAYMELKAALDNMADEMPDGCGTPEIIEVSLDSDATISVAAISKDGSDILEYINEDVVPKIERQNGVAQVDVVGSRDKYTKVVLNEERLKQYGLSLSQVAADIAGADFDMPVGTLHAGNQDIAANAYSEIDWRTALTSLSIQTKSGELITLSDITDEIGLFEEDVDAISRYNGKDSVLIQVDKKSTAETRAVCKNVLNELNKNNDGKVEYQVVHSAADDINDSLQEVLKTLIEGVAITMVVLFVFLENIKASLIVGSSMPLSLFVAAIALSLLKMPFDLMTGTGMIIAIGMLVDNSIVILESCFRMQEQGLDYKEAALKGTSTMMFSVLGSTLTTIVVYAPISLATGMSGQMNKPLCYTVIFTMVASLVNAITTVPLLFTLIKPQEKTDLPINRILEKLSSKYKKVMPVLLKAPKRVIGVALVLFVIAIGLASTINFDVFPPSYDGSIKVAATFRSGTKLEVMDERIKEVEASLLKDKNFDSVELSIDSSGVEITAYSKDNKRTSEEAVEKYTKEFEGMTDVDINVTPTGVTTGLASLMSSGNSETITLESENQDKLAKGAAVVEEALKEVPGVTKVSNAADASRTTARFHIDQQEAKFAGMQPSTVATQIYTMLNGMTAAEIEGEDGNMYDIKVQYHDGEYNDPAVLLSQYVSNSKGTSVALKDICSIEYTEIPQSIHRVDGKYVTEITATVNSGAKYQIASDISKKINALDLPSGVEQAQSIMDAQLMNEMSSMGTALVTAVFLVFLVMAIQFESVKYSLMVMMCIPFSLIGTFGLMFLFGEPLSMMAMMGVLMLVGMVVNNGILLVDGTNELKKEMDLHSALIQAGLTRLRPILMTTLTTILSMLPLLLSGNSGMNMMHGMGVVIIGGLLASTILAMFLMPPFYIVMDKGFKLKKGRK